MKAAARQIIETSLMDIPAYALTDQELWTAKLVKEALVEAYEVLSDTTGRVGPRSVKAYWPDYQIDGADFTIQSIAGTNTVGRMRVRRQRTMREIGRMEIVLLGSKGPQGQDIPAWLNGTVAQYERPRKCLMAWVMCKHHGVTEKGLCERAGWPLATFKRHKDYAAGVIAHNLNQAGVEPWR
jgi:hypothetical protein